MTTSNKTAVDDAKAKALASFLKSHTPKKAKKGDAVDPVRISTLADSTAVDVEAISTGSLSLDHALGIGGIPRGRITELYGPTGGGKTTLALETAKRCQDDGGIIGFVDAEQALNRELVNQIGIDPDRFVIAQTETAEQAMDVCDNMVRSGAFDMIIIDSAAAMIPKQEFEADYDAQQMGLQARMLSKFMRKIVGPVSQYDVALLIVNQVRTNLQMYGAPEESTGGKALKFFSSVRIEVRTSNSKQIKEGSEVIGTEVTATTKKNKFASPFRKCNYEIIFGKGIDNNADVFNVATELGVIEKEGITYFVRQVGTDLQDAEVKIGVGLQKAKDGLEADENLFEQVTAAVKARLSGKSPAQEEATEGDPSSGAQDTDATAPANPAPTAPVPEAADDDFFGLDG